MSWEKKDKNKKFSVPIKKEIKKTDKYGRGTIETISLTKQSSLIMQDLWQVYYQILLIISQKESIKLNAKLLIVF